MPVPTELVTRLTAYVKSGAGSTSTADQAFIESALEQAMALVDTACGASIGLVPVEVLEGWYIEVGAELYNRRQTKNGVTQFATADGGTAIRVRQDPLASIRVPMSLYLPGGFA